MMSKVGGAQALSYTVIIGGAFSLTAGCSRNMNDWQPQASCVYLAAFAANLMKSRQLFHWSLSTEWVVESGGKNQRISTCQNSLYSTTHANVPFKQSTTEDSQRHNLKRKIERSRRSCTLAITKQTVNRTHKPPRCPGSRNLRNFQFCR